MGSPIRKRQRQVRGKFLLGLALGFVVVIPGHAEQVCKPQHIRAATPTADFIDNPDGTVTHKRTGLVWMRCSLGQTWDGKSCTGEAKKLVWKEALQAAAAFNAAGGHAGHKDWRLPNIKELDSIVETQCMEPSINSSIFPNTPSARYWSSTLSTTSDKDYAWYIRFNSGYLDDGRVVELYDPNNVPGKYAYHARLVRGGNDFDALAGRR